ncbi:MAG TPA: CDP-alcohol phosphatidyltransferase family protein, partial [Euzebyales bacterium]|nr:CDP-alcohol phosphatidyltransferase family protein [Euzebyales bacterium]
TLLARLIRQLRDVGVEQVIVLTRPRWADAFAQTADVAVEGYASVSAMLDRLAQLARTTSDDLLIADADLLTNDAVAADLVLDGRVRTGVLSSSAPPSSLGSPPLRVAEGRVAASGSAYHGCDRANARLLGMCKIGRADLGSVADVLDELAKLAADPPAEWSAELERKRAALATEAATRSVPGWAERSIAALRDDPLPLVVVGLVRRDVPVTPVPIRALYWGRPGTARAAVTAFEELRRIDEDAVLLDAAVKDVDGFFTTFLVSPYSRYIARWAARRGLTPNQITVASMGLGLLAAAAFAVGSRLWLIAGAILLQLAFIADCVDGQLARYTRQFSNFGAWLDSTLDRGKEYIVYAGLAVGATHPPAAAGIWFMATAALTLQTFRHYADFSHGAQRREMHHRPIRHRLEEPGESSVGTQGTEAVAVERVSATRTGAGRTALDALVLFGRRPWVTWAKRIVVLPIGERFALISVTAAVWDARVTFAALLLWGTLAAAYATAIRVLRSNP